MTTLKESAIARVSALDAQSKDEEGFSSGDSKLKGNALIDEGSGLGAMSRLAQTTWAALAAINPPPLFNPLAQFMAHLHVEYGGFRRDQMHCIQDFCCKKEDTPRTMYIWLSRLAAEAGDVFTERQLVKIFISKLDKRMVELISPHLLFRYYGNATLAQTFAEVEELDRALGVSKATNLVTLQMDTPESKKLATATGSLTKAQPEKVVYCWGCDEASHVKGNPTCSKK